MAISETMTKAFNEQINKELFSAYLYLSMSAWAEAEDLPGLANWMRVQSQEEVSHAMILFNHVAERGGRVRMAAIEQPAGDFDSIVAVFDKTLEHEQFVTRSINDLMALAEENRDFAARNRLEWFVEEQVEEENAANALLVQAKRVGTGEGLVMMDRELAARVFTVPAPLAGGAA